jgi:hypothetical protein
VRSQPARSFYETEALRGGWTSRQLDRQIQSQFYERTALSQRRDTLLSLVFFHRRLRSLVVIDLKIGKFTHADAGQMHLYLNYVREHWMLEGENPPVGLILCAEKDRAVARYALDGLPNKVIAAEYRMALPNEEVLVRAIETTRRRITRGK